MKYDDILNEFTKCLSQKTYDLKDAIEINGYTAKQISELNPNFGVCGVYTFMKTLRDDKENAEKMIKSGFPNKDVVPPVINENNNDSEKDMVEKYRKEIEEEVDTEMIGLGLLTVKDGRKIPVFGGGQDSKIILLDNGIVKDYAMNTLCAAGTGAFLSSQAKRLDIDIEKFGDLALESKNPVKIAARCTVFAESDLIHKAQIGYEKKDIVAGLCKSIVLNYLNNVGKGKKIYEPIVFQGGVSKNKGVVKYFEEVLGKKVITLENGHLMGALGVAILSKNNKTDRIYNLDIEDIKFKTKGIECQGCSNHCEILKIYKNDQLIDTWGNRCEKTTTFN